MKGLDEFLKIFGDITVLQIVETLLACAFLWFIYKKTSNFLIQQHEQQKLKDAQLKEALDGVHKYPEYRKQSLDIQTELKGDIRALKDAQAEITQRLVAMEEQNKERFSICMSGKRGKMKSFKMSNRVASNYYKNMPNIHQIGQSYFLDKKN